MPKIGRHTGPSLPDGTRPRAVDSRPGVDLELLGGDLTVDDVVVGGRARAVLGGVLGVEDLTHVPAVARWRQKLAKARSGGVSVQIIVLADSMGRFTTTRYRNAWIDRLRRRFQGSTPGSLGLLPATENVFAVTGDANWPGGDDPWTYTGAVTGNVTYGTSRHAVNVPSGGGAAQFTYFGDKCVVFFVRNSTGPTACAVTLDGVAQTAIDATEPTEAASQQAGFGTHGNYGFHTLVLTPNNGTLILEGVEWFDGDAPFFTTGSVILLDGSHAGFSAFDFAASDNNNWSAAIAGAEAFCGMSVIALGANDISNGRTTQQFEDDLVTICQRIDARLAVPDMCHLFVVMPGITRTAFVDAARRAARRVGLGRAAVYDAAALRADRRWGGDLSDDGVHPNDSGHTWMAETLGQVLDPTPTTLSPSTPERIVIDASTSATARTSWTEAWTALTGFPGGYDQSGGGSTLGERVHRRWADPGTYRGTLTYHQDSGLGSIEVLVGRWVGNTPTLTALNAAIATAGAAGPVTVRLGTTVETHIAGWVPIVVRKTTASGAVRFVQLVLDKVA